jgi:hypothetical protein
MHNPADEQSRGLERCSPNSVHARPPIDGQVKESEGHNASTHHQGDAEGNHGRVEHGRQQDVHQTRQCPQNSHH